jgi:hypothetical protein
MQGLFKNKKHNRKYFMIRQTVVITMEETHLQLKDQFLHREMKGHKVTVD